MVVSDALIAVARTSPDKLEIQDLVARRRWRIDYPADGPTDAFWLPGGLADRLEVGSLDKRGRTILDRALKRGWRLSAAYLAATDNYPFLDYADSGFQEDRVRMRNYGDDHADEDRSITSVAPDSNASVGGTSKAHRLALTVFGSTTWSKMPWAGQAIFRRTSASGGSRHPVNGYLVPAGSTELLYVNPRFNRFEDHGHRAPRPIDDDQLLLSISPDRNRYRYREPRTFRTLFMDLGHLLQTLQAVAADFGFAVSVSDLLFPRIDMSRCGWRPESSPLSELPVVVCRMHPLGEPFDESAESKVDEWIDLFGRRDGVDDSAVWGMVVSTTNGEAFTAAPGTQTVSPLRDTRSRAFASLDEWRLDEWMDTGWCLAMELFLADAPDAPRAVTVPTCGVAMPLHTAYVRRSARKFGSSPVSADTLASVVAAQSSGDALTPYVIAFSVNGLAPGVHRWRDGAWEWVGCLLDSDIARFGERVMSGQPAVLTCAAILCAVADLETAAQSAPGEQGLMRVWIEAGAVVQGWHLLATEASAAGYPTPAVHDASMDEVLRLEVGRQTCVHTLVFGSKVHG